MDGFLGGLLFGNVDEEGQLDNDDFDKEIQEGLQSFVRSKQVTDILSLSLDGLGKEDREREAEEAEARADREGQGKGAMPGPATQELSVERVRSSRLAGILFTGQSSQVRFTNLFRSAEFSHEFASGDGAAAAGGGGGGGPSVRRYRLRRYRVRRRKQARALAYVEDQREAFRRRGWGHAGAGIAGDTLVRAMMLSSSSSGAISAIGGLLPGGLGSGAGSRYRILSQLRASAAAIKKQSGAARRVGTRALDVLFERYAATEAACRPVARLGGGLARIAWEERQFHPVQTTCWEERIVFDEAQAAGLLPGWEAPRLTKAFVQVPKAVPGVRPALFGGSRPGTPFLPGYGSFVPSRAGSGYATPVAPAAARPANLLRRPRCEATRLLNADLERGDWLQAVIWDEGVPPAALPSTRLLLNLNDPLLLVDVEEAPAAAAAGGISLKDISRLTKMINKAKSRRGMNGEAAAGAAGSAGAPPPKAINFGKCQSGDRFNLSSDKHYDAGGTAGDAAPEAALSKATQQTLVKSQLAARIGLQHSVPALKLLPPFFRTAWGKADIRAWHRPGLAAPIEPAWTFGALPAASNRARTATGTVVAQVVRSAKRLSLRDAASEYVLLEYSEEHPLVLMNAGMATFIHQVYRRAGPKDPVPPVDAAGYGSLKVLEPGEPGPFWIFGDVEPGRVLPAIQNNLFRAPLFEHAPSGTDFLAIRAHQKGRAGSRLYLRALPPKLLLAGQTFPTAQVFGPHSRKHNNYCRGRIQVFAYRLLAKDVAALQSGMQPRLRISRILAAFPLFSEGSVRKWLKEYADSLRGGKDSGVWVRKPDAPVLGEDSLRALVTPEAVCVYEAMLAGQQRLADAGFVLASAEADEEPGEDHLDEGGAGEVQLAPWHLTANLANAIIGKSALQVRGPGEPSGGRGEAFSFARMPTRMANNDATGEKRGGHRSGPDQAAYRADIARIWAAQLSALSNPVPPEPEAESAPALPATAGGGGGEAACTANLMDAWKDIQRTIAEDDEVSVTSRATSRATSANATTQAGSALRPAGRRLVVTRTASGPNGEALLEMETLTDPFVIQAYLKERRAFDIKTRRRAQMAAAAAAKAASRPPRPAKAPKPGKAVVPRAAQPAAAAAAAKKSVQVRCGTCGAVGHMRTNRVCPLYAEYEASIARDAEPVRVDGTKLTISKQSLSAALKRKADRTPVAVVAARKERAQAPPLTFGQQRALGEMSLLLQDILARLAGMQASWPFRKPVSRKDYPHYFALVAKPLDLGTVKARARKLAYRSPAAFLADVRLIRDNCVQFNGPDHPFSAMAGEIVARAEEAVGEHAERFGQWAALLDAPVTGGDELAAAEGGEHAAAEDGEHEPHDQDGGGGGGEEDSHHEMIVDV